MLIARQSQPDSSDGEMARFGFCAAPSLVFFFGGGGGGGGGELVLNIWAVCYCCF